MNNKCAIRAILSYYNKLREEYVYFKKNNMNTEYIDGETSAIKYILTNVYGLNKDDNRF